MYRHCKVRTPSGYSESVFIPVATHPTLYNLNPKLSTLTLSPKPYISIYIRWTPHPVIVTIGDNRDHIRVLLYSYYTTITRWGSSYITAINLFKVPTLQSHKLKFRTGFIAAILSLLFEARGLVSVLPCRPGWVR